MFKLEMSTDNASFGDDIDALRISVGLILLNIAHHITDRGDLDGVIRDVNGKRIGAYSLTPKNQGE